MRPTDLATLRGQMQQWLTSDSGSEFFRLVTQKAGFLGVENPSTDQVTRFHASEVERFSKAALYFIGASMVGLARDAAMSMPSFRLDPSDLPSDYGLVYFDQPIGVSGKEGAHEVEMDVVACTWGIDRVQNGSTGLMTKGVWLSLYTKTDQALLAFEVENADLGPAAFRQIRSMQGPLTQDEEAFLPFGVEWPVPATTHRNSVAAYAYTLRCAWLLMQQPVTTVRNVLPDRAAARRMQRQGYAPSSVRVVTLRHASNTDPSKESGRDYAHQWVVKGHWRKQWYATQDRHIPIWIQPHIKGPDGAPLLGGEKVYAWTR